MTEEEWTRLLAAYRRGLAADIIQFQDSAGVWGVIWTVPPCSPAALERAARQAARCRVVRVRHIRRARLVLRGGPAVEVVVVTEAMPVIQVVRDLSNSRPVLVGQLLQDDGLRALMDANVCADAYPVPV
jgi:hypothetical protein